MDEGNTAAKDAGRPTCDHEPFASDEGGPVFCRKCQWPMKTRVTSPGLTKEI